MSASSRQSGGGRLHRASSGGRSLRAPLASNGGRPSQASSGGRESGGGAGTQPSSFERSEFLKAADDNTRPPVESMRRYMGMVNGRSTRTAGYFNAGVGKMLEPQADSVATLHKIHHTLGLGGAVLGTQQGTGKTLYEAPAFFATMNMVRVRPGFFLVSAINYDDVLASLEKIWHPETMAIVPVLDLTKIPRPARGIRTLYVIKHGTNARGGQVNSLALEDTAWPALAAMKPAVVLVDECASAMVQPGSVLAKCIQRIRGRDGFVVLIEARFKKFAAKLPDVQRIIVALAGGRKSRDEVAKMSTNELARYVVYHKKSKYEEHLPLKRFEHVAVDFAIPVAQIKPEEYVHRAAGKIARRIKRHKLAKVVIAGSTLSDRAHPEAVEVEIIRKVLHEHGIDCMSVKSGRTIAGSVELFVKTSAIQAFILSQSSTRGLDQLKIVGNMFWLGKKGILDGQDGKVPAAMLEDQESALCRIRRLGSPHKAVTYWTLTPQGVQTPARGSSPAGGGSGWGGGSAGSAGDVRGSAVARRLSVSSTTSSGKRRASDAGEQPFKQRRVEVFGIKVNDGQTSKRFGGDSSLTFKALVENVAAEFGKAGSACTVSYKDTDGDMLEISTGRGWAECIRIRTDSCISLTVRFD